MPIQHLLEKQREEFEKKFPTGSIVFEKPSSTEWYTGSYKDISEVKSFLSTIQQEILQAVKEKIEEIFKNADEREDRVELSDITSWLEGDKK